MDSPKGSLLPLANQKVALGDSTNSSPEPAAQQKSPSRGGSGNTGNINKGGGGGASPKGSSAGKAGGSATKNSATKKGRDVQSALIGRHYVTERDSVPVQYNGVV